MITSLFLDFVFALANFIVDLLPESTALPSYVNDTISYIFGFLQPFDFVINLTSTFVCLGLAVTIDGILLVWLGGHWLLRKIPFLHIS